MAASRIPGPIGTSALHQNLDDGTMTRALSPLPGSIGVSRAFVGEGHRESKNLILLGSGHRITAVATEKVLRQGSRGPEVEKLQRLLNVRAQPAPKLKLDGVFGPVTSNALQQYQRGVSIAADGVANKQTWFYLLKDDRAAVLRPPNLQGNRTVMS